MSFFSRFKIKVNWLIGDVEETALEVRLFNGICLLGIPITFYNIPFNIVVGLHTTAGIFTFITALLVILYYLSRFKKKHKYSVLVSGILMNVLFAINYFYADGVSGASLLSFTLLLFGMIIISPKSQHFFWFILIFSTLWLVIIMEYLYPDRVKKSYESVSEIIVDLGSTVSITMIVISLVLMYLKRQYNRERTKGQKNLLALKEMDSQKTKLFSVLSHDLKASLHSLNSYLELIKSNALKEADRREMEDLLSSSVSSTQAMLSNILNWSKGQLMSVNNELRYQDVSYLLEETVGLYTHEAERKGIAYCSSIDPNIPATVNAEMFKIVVGNLIVNALKFTEEGGVVQVSLIEEEDGATIKIRDNGRGIDKEKQKRLFSLDIDSTYGTANEKGVGLGLYLCKQFTLEQNGQIGFESEKDVGSVFFVKFPM